MIMGQDTDMKENFWVLATFFQKLLMQPLFQMQDGINNRLLQSKEEYEGALWLCQLLTEMVNQATNDHLKSIQRSQIDLPLVDNIDNEMRRTLNSPTISLLDKRENERVNRASDLTGGYSYTSQFCDQQRIAQEVQEY